MQLLPPRPFSTDNLIKITIVTFSPVRIIFLFPIFIDRRKKKKLACAVRFWPPVAILTLRPSGRRLKAVDKMFPTRASRTNAAKQKEKKIIIYPKM